MSLSTVALGERCSSSTLQGRHWAREGGHGSDSDSSVPPPGVPRGMPGATLGPAAESCVGARGARASSDLCFLWENIGLFGNKAGDMVVGSWWWFIGPCSTELCLRCSYTWHTVDRHISWAGKGSSGIGVCEAGQGGLSWVSSPVPPAAQMETAPFPLIVVAVTLQLPEGVGWPQQGDIVRAAVHRCLVGAGIDLLGPQ